MKWEYTTIYLAHFELSIESNSLVEALNEMGQVGWQLIAVDNGMIYFKRMVKVELSTSIERGEQLEEVANILEEAISRLTSRGI